MKKTVIKGDIFDHVKGSCQKKANTSCSCGCSGKKKNKLFATRSMATITGTLIDKATKQPMFGANILNLSTKKGTVTDDNGSFEIDAQPDDLIRISFVGFKTIKQPASKLPKQIFMEEEVEMLNEVIVTAKKELKKHSNWWLWGLLALGVVVYVKAKK